METFFIILAAVLILLAGAFFYVCYLLFALAVSKDIPRIMRPLMSGLLGGFNVNELEMTKTGHEFFDSAEKEKWTLTSRDGLKLSAWYIPSNNARATIILMHGYRSSAMHDFSGVLPFYNSLGLNVLLCDQRAHGESEGKYIGYGLLERYDLQSWACEHNRRIGEGMPLILDGISMGGATVLFSSALDMPENVVGMIDDCGYYSAKEQIQHVMRLMKIPVFPFYHVANGFCRVFAGYSFSELDARESLKKTKIPVLFIHGGADDFVPCEMGRSAHDSCASEKRIFISKEASHGMSYVLETERCQEMLRDFLDLILENKKGD